jgi:hypothetical protein
MRKSKGRKLKQKEGRGMGARRGEQYATGVRMTDNENRKKGEERRTGEGGRGERDFRREENIRRRIRGAAGNFLLPHLRFLLQLPPLLLVLIFFLLFIVQLLLLSLLLSCFLLFL